MSTLITLFSRPTKTRRQLKWTEAFTRNILRHVDECGEVGEKGRAADLREEVAPFKCKVTLELPHGGPRSAIQMEFNMEGARPEFLGAKYYLVGEWDSRITLTKQTTPGLWRLVEEYRCLVVGRVR